MLIFDRNKENNIINFPNAIILPIMIEKPCDETGVVALGAALDCGGCVGGESRWCNLISRSGAPPGGQC